MFFFGMQFPLKVDISPYSIPDKTLQLQCIYIWDITSSIHGLEITTAVLDGFPLVMTNSLLLMLWPIEFVDLSTKNGDFPVRYVSLLEGKHGNITPITSRLYIIINPIETIKGHNCTT